MKEFRCVVSTYAPLVRSVTVSYNDVRIHCNTLCVDKENGKVFDGNEYAVRLGCPTLARCTQACNVHGIVPGLA